MTASDAAFGPVTYARNSDARLRQLSRRMTRRSTPIVLKLGITLFWVLWIVVFLTIFFLVNHFLVYEAAPRLGLPHQLSQLLAGLGLLGIVIAVVTPIRRRLRAMVAASVNTTVTLGPAATGLHFAGDELEYIVKWAGIHELVAEPDGIVVVCGGLWFLVPDRAFATAAARNAFLDHVAAHLPPEALARSETELQRARRK